jgi:hypothetical protein
MLDNAPSILLNRTAGLCLAVFLTACSSTPWHEVYPYPEYIEAGVQSGKEVRVVTTDGNEHVFVADTAEDGRVKGHMKDQPIQVPYEDVVTLQIRSDEFPDMPCGGAVPLGCSIPEVLTAVSAIVADYQNKFHSACVFHDFCYRHGHITYGIDRDQCDAVFFDSMKEICDVKLVSFDFVLDPLTEGKCLLAASNLYASVKRYGEEYYRVDNSTYCEYRFPAEDDMDTSGLVGMLLEARRKSVGPQ